MWHLLRKSYSIQVSRVRVMQVLWEEDPEATTQRRAHKLVWRDYFSFESNFCWHCDNYDKLKPYGLPIYVSINGFSRTVIWLEVCRTNSNPRVVAAMYIRAVQSLGLVPKMLRTDHGNKTGSWLLFIVHWDKMLIRIDMEHLLQTSALKVSGHIFVALLPVG